MGVTMTKLNLCNITKLTNGVSYYDPSAPEPEITLEQSTLLTGTWRLIKDDITKVGIITFVRYLN